MCCFLFQVNFAHPNKASEGKTEQGQYLARPPSHGLSRAVHLDIQRRCLMAKERHMHLQKKKPQSQPKELQANWSHFDGPWEGD